MQGSLAQRISLPACCHPLLIHTARDCWYTSAALEMMELEDKDLLRKQAALFPLPKGVKFSYGTAGFRTDAALLPSTVFRMGVLAALRSLCTKRATGLMITASHNPVHENGVKLADPSGGMLNVAWEPYSDMLANAPDVENFLQIVEHIVKRENIQSGNAASGEVLLARDTRPSGEALVSAARQGVEAVRGTVAHDMGVLTTPQLHWVVRSFNNGVPASESDYFHQLSDSFRCASIDGDADRLVYFYIPEKHEDGYSGPVCTLHLLDGDKIAAIFGLFIIGQLHILAGSKSSVSDATTAHKAVVPGYGEVKFAVVQTAYANGASTNYIKQVLGLEVATTPTGVKHLHKKAEQYDIGIYFEANGHGTILFNEIFSQWLQDASVQQKEAEHRQAAKRLVAVNEMVNQAVGDALSGILMVEVVLRYQGWSVEQWDSMYKDLPSRQLKVKVKDRAVIITTPDETRVASPSSLQEAIDTEVGKYKGGRAFVRPSGTEDVVRVYAEASSQQSADALAQAVCVLVYHLAGGVGPEP
ncbi:unnamed protein product [Sphagnum troendelagicum]|uniref:phosphoacetylglucosamine mutase n=1 Tax=Sphagnum troendelagicum TaxID=128251 RepID=A0ABP0TFA9_9BRYO